MNTQTANKLHMYKAVETVFTGNRATWHLFPGLQGILSRFALKVAQIDLLSNGNANEQSGERIRDLIRETDHLLRSRLDKGIAGLRQQNTELYAQYVSARTRC